MEKQAVTMHVDVCLSEVRPVLAAAKTAGVDVTGLASAYEGLREWETAPGPSLVPIVNYFRIERDIARNLDDLTAQMSTRRLTYTTGKFVMSHLQSAHTLQDAVQGLADYFNMMHGGEYNRIRRTATSLVMVIDDREFPYTLDENAEARLFMGDCVLIKTHALLNSLSDGQAGKALKRAAIVRVAQTDKDRHLGYWNVPVSVGQSAYELVFDLDLALHPIPAPGPVDLSSPGIFARVIQQLETHGKGSALPDMLARVTDLIRDGVENQEDVARRLDISVATLRRRLDANDLKFRELVLEERHDKARQMLTKGTPVADVSEEIGYSDIRAFSRAFKKRFGATPAEYRKQAMTDT